MLGSGSGGKDPNMERAMAMAGANPMLEVENMKGST